MNYFVQFIEMSQNSLVDEHEVLIVEKIIENIDQLYNLNLEELAIKSYSSSATIIRFLQRLGFESYTDFKIKVYQDYCGYTINSFEHSPIQKSLNYQLKSYHLSIENINLQRMIDLAKLLTHVRSVTLVAKKLHLEDLHVLQLTLIAYGIPCFRYNNHQSFLNHLALLEEDDLVLYVQNTSEYEAFIKDHPKPKKALLQVNYYDYPPFKEEETYLLIQKGKDEDDSMLLIGQIFYYFITYVVEEDRWQI